MKLHIGCGKRLLPGWINLDLKRPPHGRKPFNALRPWPFKSDSAEAIFSEDLFEHFTQPEHYLFLAETYRVLANGGITRINAPDATWSIRNWVRKGSFATQGMKAVCLTREPYDASHGRPHRHMMLPTAGYLHDILPCFGFVEIMQMKRNQSRMPNFPSDSRPIQNTRDAEIGNVFMEAVKR